MQNNITLAVVDDLPADREVISSMLTGYAAQRGLRWSVDCFASGEAFLERLWQKQYDAVFLDVLMDGMNGIEIARQLRELSPDTLVVFVTTEADYAVEGYEVEAVGFLLKDERQQQKRFDRLMNRLEPRLRRETLLTFESAGGVIALTAGEILYAEVTGHSMNLHTRDRVHILRMTMEELKPILAEDGRFCECHRGIVINLDAVERLSGQVVTMENGDTLPVSRRQRATLEQAYAARNIYRIRREL